MVRTDRADRDPAQRDEAAELARHERFALGEARGHRAHRQVAGVGVDSALEANDPQRRPPHLPGQLVADPLHLFDGNAFHPYRDTLAFSEHLFVPALLAWQFSAEDASRIKCPVLHVGGTDSGPWFAEVRRLILGWFPNAESDVPSSWTSSWSSAFGAAMSPRSVRDGLTYLRPWLDIGRQAILQQAREFADLSGWAPVQDPTNADDSYTRAAVRERLAPALNERWPGWQGNLLRHARQSAELKDVLDEVACQDFSTLDPSADARNFSLAAWRSLSKGRQALVLRYWLATLGQRMPTDARLQDVMRQLRGLHALGHDRQMQVKHGNAWIRCLKGRVFLDEGGAAETKPGEKR